MARPVAPRGQGRERVLAAALDLFAEHGTSGTSLQMIADRMGVTKAAVYFQFHAKDDIVLAVLQPVFDRLEGLVEAAEAVEGRAEQVDAVVTGLVDVVVDHRRLVALLRGDPSVGRHLEEHEPMPSVVARLGALMLGPDPSPSARVAASVAGAGLMLATADPQARRPRRRGAAPRAAALLEAAAAGLIRAQAAARPGRGSVGGGHPGGRRARGRDPGAHRRPLRPAPRGPAHDARREHHAVRGNGRRRHRHGDRRVVRRCAAAGGRDHRGPDLERGSDADVGSGDHGGRRARRASRASATAGCRRPS
ncbi:hypothetical protein GCM10025868_41010 [Angustibacter aerolatus]|uniref:HTH tetR-type domain-containing protein n=1 Tax=Angustibacter aerolatus TaxID=1162965 RepID=A0ABQ6JQA1_9ACTN|nr:TetR/AcrR family transcriptional regulator [Angustibacter aerolatus]GMA88851.1 hypothetical protein GCM10025868_41010 [Angustibacter aerolatus]